MQARVTKLQVSKSSQKNGVDRKNRLARRGGRRTPQDVAAGTVISRTNAAELNSGSTYARNRGQLTVAIAQLVERQVVVLDVAGSSPVGHPAGERDGVIR